MVRILVKLGIGSAVGTLRVPCHANQQYHARAIAITIATRPQQTTATTSSHAMAAAHGSLTGGTLSALDDRLRGISDF